MHNVKGKEEKTYRKRCKKSVKNIRGVRKYRLLN